VTESHDTVDGKKMWLDHGGRRRTSTAAEFEGGALVKDLVQGVPQRRHSLEDTTRSNASLQNRRRDPSIAGTRAKTARERTYAEGIGNPSYPEGKGKFSKGKGNEAPGQHGELDKLIRDDGPLDDEADVSCAGFYDRFSGRAGGRQVCAAGEKAAHADALIARVPEDVDTAMGEQDRIIQLRQSHTAPVRRKFPNHVNHVCHVDKLVFGDRPDLEDDAEGNLPGGETVQSKTRSKPLPLVHADTVFWDRAMGRMPFYEKIR
jgi:hypothetical protein